MEAYSTATKKQYPPRVSVIPAYLKVVPTCRACGHRHYTFDVSPTHDAIYGCVFRAQPLKSGSQGPESPRLSIDGLKCAPLDPSTTVRGFGADFAGRGKLRAIRCTMSCGHSLLGVCIVN